jgi:aminoglycoside phosphotransferase (APT) family kinase protein
VTAAAGKREERRAREMARAVVELHLGGPPKRVRRAAGGITNFVYLATHADGEFVVRLSSDPVKINVFLKEQWAISRVREIGVPVPEVLEVGNQIGWPYMIARAVPGRPATDHPERLTIIEEFGRIAARIHTIATEGFGETFDWSQNRLSRVERWSDYLHHQLDVGRRVALLVDQRLLTGPQAKALKAELRRIASWTDPPSLNHGDLRLKNLLVDDEGHVTALIDWEFCQSVIAPHWELSLALHDLSIDQKHALLAGYGLSPAAVREMAPAWQAFNVLHYAPYVERALARRDHSKLETYRIRLSGALDLYSLR